MILVRDLLRAGAIAGFVVLTSVALLWGDDYQPKIAPASDEGERGLKRIRVPEGTVAKLVAAEPRLANPVAFWIDRRGRFYVCETFRQGNAVTDNRGKMFWLDDDLAARTVADRLAYHKKHLKEKLVEFTREHDRIRLLEDRDGDGIVDHDAVFTTGYNDVVEGTGAGVLEHKGHVYYTNIPHLWKLRDTNGDGVADEKTSLHDGYGVRVAFRGHDMHGLTVGPDGRIYYSIGDRGFNVTHEGRTYEYPEQGAVFRCEPDGSHLEVVHLGLRNPQELAFDEFGRLFTGDNNSDGGDQARWVQIVDGGESGWRMYYQYLNDRGPWNREKLWHLPHAGQAAYIVPPIANVASGPSGLAYYPGVGLSERFKNHFFLCDFRGQDSNSGIRTFALQPKGASFELADSKETVWSVLATDCDFGPDGALYVSDWVEGWDGPGKGRIYKIEDSAFANSAEAKALKTLFAEGFEERSTEELAKLLEHPHFRVRLEAQWALVERPDGAARLRAAAMKGPTTHSRLHGVWGLGQIARRAGRDVLKDVLALLEADDPHVRAQVAKVIGETSDGNGPGIWPEAAKRLRSRLAETDAAVRLEVINALGRVGDAAAVPELVEVLERVNDGDPYLRHGVAVALARLAQVAGDENATSTNTQALVALRKHASPAVRRGAVLALRRLKAAGLGEFLNDADLTIVEEAARAIYDMPVTAAYDQLAACATRPNLTEPTWWRVVNANFRLNQPKLVADIAARDSLPTAIRVEAVQALGDWAKPSGRDRVLGDWRPLPERSSDVAKEAFQANLPRLLTGTDDMRKAVLEVGVKIGVQEIGPTLAVIVADTKQSVAQRADAMAALGVLKSPQLGEVLKTAIHDEAPEVRAAARTALARTSPGEALPGLKSALEQGTPLEVQGALRALPLLANDESDAVLAEQLARLSRGELPAEARLDAIEAALARGTDPLKQAVKTHFEREPAEDPLRGFRETLAGGNAERGRRLFFEKSEVSCSRCHVSGGHGGEVGPNLSKIGAEKPRDYLLTAIVHPDKEIAKGFETLVIETESGLVVSGIVRQETATHLKLVTPEAKLIEVPKAEIVEQARGKSGMPADLIQKLSREEVRDLVEYLASQKGNP